MLPYKNVYSLENGALIKNKENKIEYIDENGKKRVKTNPSYKDFAKVGKYPLKENGISPSLLEGGIREIIGYKLEDGYIVPIHNEEKMEETEK